MAPEDPVPWETLSAVIGWTYFVAWSVSFYPQVYTNWKRKSVVGLSFDFEAYNVLGFTCMTIYNTSLLWNENVRALYQRFNDGNLPLVAPNDVAFSIHALALTLVHVFQICIYERGNQKVSYSCWSVIYGALVIIVAWAIVAGSGGSTWYTFVNAISYIKLAISLIKYIPQVYLNYKRKSTIGWNILNILLDFTGGLLSIIQLILDSWIADAWGNAFKFILGFISITFDTIFMLQHYVFYRNSNSYHSVPDGEAPKDDDSEESALSGSERSAEDQHVNPGVYGSVPQDSADAPEQERKKDLMDLRQEIWKMPAKEVWELFVSQTR